MYCIWVRYYIEKTFHFQKRSILVERSNLIGYCGGMVFFFFLNSTIYIAEPYHSPHLNKVYTNETALLSRINNKFALSGGANLKIVLYNWNDNQVSTETNESKRKAKNPTLLPTPTE